MQSAKRAFALTPNDSTVLTTKPRAIWVGGAGALTVILAGDTTPTTFAAVPAGTWMWLSVTKVMATGTAATNLVGII